MSGQGDKQSNTLSSGTTPQTQQNSTGKFSAPLGILANLQNLPVGKVFFGKSHYYSAFSWWPSLPHLKLQLHWESQTGPNAVCAMQLELCEAVAKPGLWFSLSQKTKTTTPVFPQGRMLWRQICTMVKSRYIGDGHPTFDRNPYNGYINPYYWVDDHPLLYGNNGSLV